jgi:hypothetical protein
MRDPAPSEFIPITGLRSEAGQNIQDVIDDNKDDNTGDDDNKNGTDELNAPPEGVNADGSIMEGYEKDADGKVIKSAPADDNDGDTDEDDNPGDTVDHEAFYKEVENITGRVVEITYPEGVTPTSPEGIAHRDNVLVERGAMDFEAALKASNPRGYAYLLHKESGGTDEEFFGQSASFTLPDKADLEADADKQAEILRHDLQVRGLDKDSVEVLVNLAIKNGSLKDQAVKIHDNTLTAQAKQDEIIQQKYAEREKLITQTISEMVGTIETVVQKEMRFIVPEAARPEFNEFVKSHISFDEQTGKFVMTKELDKDNLVNTLEALFFQYKKGDLKALVERESKTKAAQSLRLSIQKNSGPKGTGNSKNKDNDFVPLSSLTKGK